MRSYCPLGRRSCIGRYRRNVLTLKQTVAWVLLWCLSGIVDISLQAVFIFYKEEWTSETIFWIWNIKGAASNEVFHILIPFALSVPTDEGSEDSSDFYVRKPSVLIPRRPCKEVLWNPCKRISVQQYVGTPAPLLKKKEEHSEICPKETYKDNVLPRKLIETQNEEMILSIPNLSQKRAFPCILYCKVHQSQRIVS